MTLSLIIGIIVLGIILVLVEILLIPGITFFGVIGGILMLLGIILSYISFGSTMGNYTLLSTAIVSVVIVLLSFKLKLWNRFVIKSTLEGKANVIDNANINIGDIITTTSKLQPVGTAIINNQKLEVSTKGEFVETNKKVEIIKIVQNKIIVKEIKE